MIKRSPPDREQFGLTGGTGRPLVCVQGLGYVGAAMAVATASALDLNGEPYFDVIGVDREDAQGCERVASLHAGRFPFSSTDQKLLSAVTAAHDRGNFVATTNNRAYELADIVIVDVHLDVQETDGEISANTTVLTSAIETLGDLVPEGTLVIVETTVPPGTCEHTVKPILAQACSRRGLPQEGILLAHSYERVMPGPDYLQSVTNFWRVYAGCNDQAAEACREFLNKVINTNEYPLRQLHSMTASETAKVLENSYRAVNIAFIEEWGRLAEAFDVDLFEVIDAVRDRPTHNNVRQPGFGVGGYCLTKDPLFPIASSNAFLAKENLTFPFAEQTVRINRRMPITNLDRIESLLGGNLAGKSILLLGVAYRSEVDDTRFSAAEIFYREAVTRGASVSCHDPFVRYWQEMDLDLGIDLPKPDGFDVIVLAVPHSYYRELNLAGWIGSARPFIYDCDNILSRTARAELRESGCRVESTGRGLGL